MDYEYAKEKLGYKIHITLDTYADVFNRMNNNAMKKFEDYSTAIRG